MIGGRRRVEPLQKDISDWRITFVDTGINSNIGERLLAVKPFLRGEDAFLANYSDGLTDFPLPTLVDGFRSGSQIASFLSVRPNTSFHFIRRREDGTVTSIDDCLGADVWINGGYFALRREIFDYMRPGDELVVEPFQRLIAEGRLSTLRYDGFWRCVDTFKDLQELERLDGQGRAPWNQWRRAADTSVDAARRADAAPVVRVPFRSAVER
jgi:glucose-1-phosphate cytidylyltransferase